MTGEAIPTVVAESWLYETLSSDAELVAATGGRIWSDLAQGDTSGVWVLFTLQTPTDLRVVGDKIIWSEGIYIVRTVGEVSSFAPLVSTAKRIHALLHGKRGQTAEGTVISCIRTAPFRLTQTVDGRTWRHLGGFYRVVTQ